MVTLIGSDAKTKDDFMLIVRIKEIQCVPA